MKHFKLAIMLMLCVFLSLPAAAGAVSFSELLTNPVPSPITVVSSKFIQDAGILQVDWKIANIPSEAKPVNIYLFLREKTSTRTTSSVSLLDILSGAVTAADLVTTTEGTIYYVTFDLLKFFVTGDFMQSMSTTTDQTAFLSDFDLKTIADENGDFIMPGFPVDVTNIPDFGDGGRFLMYLVLVNPESGDVINYALDLLQAVGFHPQGPGDDEPMDDCDTNGDGIVDDVEVQQCEMGPDDNQPGQNLPENCDTNGDGIVDEVEAEQCEMPDDIPMECDTNGDGIVDQTEADQCDLMDNPGMPDDNPGMPDDIPMECDTNGDGTVDQTEADQCDLMPQGPDMDQLPEECDTNGDGIVDQTEADQCDLMPPQGDGQYIEECDLNEDGILDQSEREECDLLPTPQDGGNNQPPANSPLS